MASHVTHSLSPVVPSPDAGQNPIASAPASKASPPKFIESTIAPAVGSLDIMSVTGRPATSPSKLLHTFPLIQAGTGARASISADSRNTPSPRTPLIGSPSNPPVSSLSAASARSSSDGSDLDVESLLRDSPPDASLLGSASLSDSPQDPFSDLTDTSRELPILSQVSDSVSASKAPSRPGALSLALDMASVHRPGPSAQAPQVAARKSSQAAVSHLGQPRKDSVEGSPSAPSRPVQNRKGSTEASRPRIESMEQFNAAFSAPNPLQGELDAARSLISTLTHQNIASRAMVTKACELAGIKESTMRPRQDPLQGELESAKKQISQLRAQILENQSIVAKVCSSSGIKEEIVFEVMAEPVQAILRNLKAPAAASGLSASSEAIVADLVEASVAPKDARERKGSSDQEERVAKLKQMTDTLQQRETFKNKRLQAEFTQKAAAWKAEKEELVKQLAAATKMVTTLMAKVDARVKA